MNWSWSQDIPLRLSIRCWKISWSMSCFGGMKRKISVKRKLNFFVFFAYFRTSVANDECKSSEISLLLARPDSTISMVIGTEIGQTVGYGEVKPASQALNHKLVGKDLVRLALLSKNAIDMYHSKFVLSFLVVGKFFCFYFECKKDILTLFLWFSSGWIRTSCDFLFDWWYKKWLLSHGRNCPYTVANVVERTSAFHRTSRPIDNCFLSLLELVRRPENGSTIITYASPFRQWNSNNYGYPNQPQKKSKYQSPQSLIPLILLDSHTFLLKQLVKYTTQMSPFSFHDICFFFFFLAGSFE